jgi:hypothetical protein
MCDRELLGRHDADEKATAGLRHREVQSPHCQRSIVCSNLQGRNDTALSPRREPLPVLRALGCFACFEDELRRQSPASP